MEDPVAEIPHVIHLLTQSPPSIQKQTIDKYFTTSAAFTHPFCRTFSFDGSRWLIWKIYQAYKIMSPRIELEVKSVAFDKPNLKLYATISQVFSIFIIPFYSAPVTLTTVLDLDPRISSEQGPRGEFKTRSLYYITSQEDFYQTSEFIKFVIPFGIGYSFILAWHAFATLLTVLMALLLSPITWLEERWSRPYEGAVRLPKE